MRKKIRLLSVFLLMLIVSPVSSCGSSGGSPYGVIDLENPPVLSENLAVYIPVAAGTRARVVPYTVPPDLSGVVGLDRGSLPPQVSAGLRERGFAVAAQGEHEFVFQAYDKHQGPKFITVDAVYQAFLGMCAGIRWELEKGALRRELESLLSSLGDVLTGIYQEARGSVRQAAGKSLAFVGVAAALLGRKPALPPEVNAQVEEEVALVERASEAGISPLFGRWEDYRAYAPPGFYLLHPGLARFHRAVNWLGRWELFPVNGEGGLSPEKRREAARMTALLVGALHVGRWDGRPLLWLWDHVYQVTRFISFRTVSLNAVAAGRVLGEVAGRKFPVSRLEDDSLMDRLADRLEEEAGKGAGEKGGLWGRWGSGFRFLETFADPGTSIFGELAPGRVPGRERSRGLDLPAALGSDRAVQLLGGFYGDANSAAYGEKVRDLRKEKGSIDPAWTRSSLFWSFLKNALTLLKSPSEGYPTFMRSDAWKDRDLYLFLASWVDDVARDRAWEKIDDPISEPVEEQGGGSVTWKGYVEPRPEVYALLAADADLLRRGLDERGLLSEDASRKLDSFCRLAMGLKSMAEKELQNQALSPEEYGVLENFGRLFLSLVSVPAEDGDGYLVPLPYAIVEAYRDREEDTVLQLSLGRPVLYYVIAPVEGKPTLTVGAGYSLYELMGTGNAALSMEEWLRVVESGTVPEVPAWTASFLR